MASTKRRMGRGGPEVAAVGFGAMGLSGQPYGAATDDETRMALLDRAWEIGCRNWDTADIYGDSEEIIGKWFSLHPERRADIFLATKFAIQMKPDGFALDSSPEYCLAAAAKSLGRLKVDYIDLYYMHRVKGSVPIEKTLGAMKQLVVEGKVRHVGLSEISSATLRRAHAVHPVAAVQVEYNPWTLDIEGESGTNLLATCRELGVAVVAYSPLGRGILTGQFRSAADFEEGDLRRSLERYQGDNFKKNLLLVDRFAEVAARKGCTPAQIVLAWLLAQGNDIFVIPGTRSAKYLEQNCGAMAVSLTKEEDLELRKLVDDAGVAGSRAIAGLGHYDDTAPLEA